MNFGGLTGDFSALKNAKAVIIPVPFDKGSTWMNGSDKGPAALIKASQFLEQFDIDTGIELYNIGVHTAKTLNACSTKDIVKRVGYEVKKYQDKFVVIIGGNHTVSIGAIMAHKDITVVQLDAHADLRNNFDNDELNHACVMARVKEKHPIIQVGIRSMDKSEWDVASKDRLFLAKDIHDNDGWMERAISLMGKDVYVTLDLDVFDPSIIPSTGTPEPGGLDWYGVTTFLRKIIKKRNLVGFDIVELCPSDNKAPDFLAAKLIMQVLSAKFDKEIL